MDPQKVLELWRIYRAEPNEMPNVKTLCAQSILCFEARLCCRLAQIHRSARLRCVECSYIRVLVAALEVFLTIAPADEFAVIGDYVGA